MINSVYNTVKIIANTKVQGAISPANFNYLAKNAQIKLISDTIDQYRRSSRDKSNAKKMREIEQVLDLFYAFSTLEKSEDHFEAPKDDSGMFNMLLEDDLSFNGTPITILPKGKFDLYSRHRLTAPDLDNPIAYKYGNKFFILPSEIGTAGLVSTSDVKIGYYRFPNDPALSYISGTTILDSEEPNDFELPLNYHDKLVVEILIQIGINLREEQVVAYAKGERQEEKQNENL